MKFKCVPWKSCQTFTQAVRDKDEFKLLSGWQQWLCPKALAFFALCHLAYKLKSTQWTLFMDEFNQKDLQNQLMKVESYIRQCLLCFTASGE